VTSRSMLLADESNFDARFVRDYARLAQMAASLRDLGLHVVLTSGSFDILHEGHSMYLEAARNYGDFLIVGVDSDAKVRARKGDDRPAVPEMERLRMVTHQRGVGLVTLKEPEHAKWDLIKAVHPDVLVATGETYTTAEIGELEQSYCGRVEVLPRMAEVNTSARIRELQLRLPEVRKRLSSQLDAFVDEAVRDAARRFGDDDVAWVEARLSAFAGQLVGGLPADG
jgi:rfaE bifunctional protein nucleotidyltransferase chain/domain